MKKNAIIFSSDVKFKRMLELEAMSIGFNLIVDLNHIEGDIYVIIDLDDDIPKEFYSFVDKISVIGFSKKTESELGDLIQICDSYLQRPFLTRDFLSLLGYQQEYTVRKHTVERPEAGVKRLSIDIESKSAVYGDTVIPLSDNEFLVFSILFQNRGQAVERATLDVLLGSDGSNMGDVYICHLRKKIDNKLGLKLIYTVRGRGYALKN